MIEFSPTANEREWTRILPLSKTFFESCLYQRLSGIGQNNPFPFQFRALEIKDDPHFMTGDPQIIQHLTSFMICDRFHDFPVHDHTCESDQAGHLVF